ncbi:conserved domain protein [Peptoniphilus sp. oral taxon 375 str. F0436]|nr:conserved domain protein [Peptoniphilus sp. oral taxon 375 str. F0436]
MKYKGFYFLLFKGPMKKVLIEKYNKAYASDIIKNSKKIYRELIKYGRYRRGQSHGLQ